MIARMINEAGIDKLRLQFFIPVLPKAWTAAKQLPGRKGVSPKPYSEYKETVKTYAKIEWAQIPSCYSHIFPHLQRVDISFQFKIPRPEFRAGRFPEPIGKPDITNCQKAIEDCLSRLFFKDDCQVVRIQSEKFWAEGDNVGVWVIVDLCRPRTLATYGARKKRLDDYGE